MLIHTLTVNKTSGFTLLEVMIAMVIFSVGMLGLAGIQGTALQNNSTAYMRTIAMQQSYNMADILRSSTSFDGVINSSFNSVNSSVGSAPTACIANDQSTNCSTSQLAASDIYHWKKRLQDTLPSGRGTVSVSGTIYTITVMWDEKRTGATGEGCSDDSTTDLKCYILHIQV